MPTANFNLPLIDGASPISIVNDMNSLATATDSAMTTLATAADIASVRQIANNARTTANSAEALATSAKGEAETANTLATSANSTANTANASASAAQIKANTLQAELANLLNFTQRAHLQQSGTVAYDLTVLVNESLTLFKLYGYVNVKGGGTLSLARIPGPETPTYGIKLDIGGVLTKKATGIPMTTGGFSCWDSVTGAMNSGVFDSGIYIGSDGNLYAMQSQTQTVNLGSGSVYKQQFPACIYINADLGDTPNPVTPV